MYLVSYYGVLSVVEDVEESAVPSQGHVKVSTAHICCCRVEKGDRSVGSDRVAGYGMTAGVCCIGVPAVSGYN